MTTMNLAKIIPIIISSLAFLYVIVIYVDQILFHTGQTSIYAVSAASVYSLIIISTFLIIVCTILTNVAYFWNIDVFSKARIITGLVISAGLITSILLIIISHYLYLDEIKKLQSSLGLVVFDPTPFLVLIPIFVLHVILLAIMIAFWFSGLRETNLDIVASEVSSDSE